MEERIKVNVDAQTRPIIGINQVRVRSVYNIYIPTHQAHLQPKYGQFATIVGQKEPDGVTVCHPDKALAKHVMLVLVNGVITCKTLPEIRVKANFITAAFPCTKSNRMEGSR